MQIKQVEDTGELSAIVESSSDAIISKKFDGTIISWNNAAERIFGFTAEEAIDKNISIIVPEELYEEEKNILEKIKNGQQIEHYETVRKTKEGNKISIALTISPIKDRKGNITGVSKIARDISDQKVAEEKQAILAAIVNSSDDAIVSKNLDGIILSWNTAAIRMFGYTETEAIGKHISIIIPPNRINEETHIIENIRKGIKVDHFETIRVAKDGKEINISLTVSPVKNKHGKIIGASKIARDITDKIEAEKQRLLFTERLKELNNYKDEFMAMASHELKTPMTIIKANLQILAQRMMADSNIDFINRTLKQVNKLTDLVNSLLDISKIQAGKLHIHTSRIDMNILLKEITDNIQQTTSTHKIFFKESKEQLYAIADSERIDQVLVNMLINAIKYSPECGDIIVEGHKNDDKIIVSIKDNGIGIPHEDLENIFSRYYRVSGLASTFKGTGIGLFVASEIIKQHGGSIWAESKLGGGSVFYFSIPAAIS
jgi:PAS domain S-box-containing protein